MKAEPADTGYESLTIEDGIVLLQWPRGGTISGPAAKRALDDVNTLCVDHPRPMLVDMALTKAVAREARTAFGLPSRVSRIALLGHSPVDRVIANFTLGVSAVRMPTRFFTDRDQAMAFLKQGRDEPTE